MILAEIACMLFNESAWIFIGIHYIISIYSI